METTKDTKAKWTRVVWIAALLIGSFAIWWFGFDGRYYSTPRQSALRNGNFEDKEVMGWEISSSRPPWLVEGKTISGEGRENSRGVVFLFPDTEDANLARGYLIQRLEGRPRCRKLNVEAWARVELDEAPDANGEKVSISVELWNPDHKDESGYAAPLRSTHATADVRNASWQKLVCEIEVPREMTWAVIRANMQARKGKVVLDDFKVSEIK